MSTSRSESTPSRWALLPALVALALVAGGCNADDDPGTTAAAAPTGPAAAATTAPAPVVSADPLIGEVAQAPDVLAALQRTLDRRSAALLAGDGAGFDQGVAPRDVELVAQQQQYFDNLRQLPLQTYSLVADPATLVRDGSSYAVNVAVTMQLTGYDALPVTTVDRYRFAPLSGGRRFRLSSVTDAAWEERNQVQSQPWDTGAIQVRSGAGVLGIFDAGSVRAAGPLLRSVETGIADVAALVPYDWSRTVVVYALSDDAFLSSIPDLPGGDPDELDAVAFPVSSDATVAGSPSAGTRLVLHSRMLDRTGPARARLLRHELTHAAVGVHDDHAPVWLSEGLAEYVSVQPEAPGSRSIARPALAAARAGFTDLPADDGFNDDASAAHYGLAWWACEYVALGAGQPALWTLLDQLEAAGAAGPVDRAAEDAVLTTLVGVNTRTLARKAGKLLLTTFEPPPPPVETVPALPSTPPAPVATAPVVPPPS